ncbi:MAG: hypothetical protein GTN53_21540, partial [Candidatus Aminicenantes bacterium]|nr:hypothetical protein [Candidatus Aminicenantes bacterium]
MRLLFIFLITAILLTGSGMFVQAYAVLHTYYVDQDTGTNVATGITTDWGTCNDGINVTTLALQDTSGSCNARMEQNPSGFQTFYEVWYNTAFVQNTTITGQATGNLWYLEERATGG